MMSELSPNLQPQNGAVVVNDCFIRADTLVCPSNADINFNGDTERLRSEIACPFDFIERWNFAAASQMGLCECDASLSSFLDPEATPMPMDCDCFVCPDQTGLFAVAYSCSTPIVGPCVSFDCRGVCNGDFMFSPATTTGDISLAPLPVTEGEGGEFDISLDLDDGCIIMANRNICPASGQFTFGENESSLDLQVSCPLEAIAESNFREASQMGLCECGALLTEFSDSVNSPRQVNCECFFCSEDSGTFGAAFRCDEPISGPCMSFDCDGVCNGDFMFLMAAPAGDISLVPSPVAENEPIEGTAPPTPGFGFDFVEDLVEGCAIVADRNVCLVGGEFNFNGNETTLDAQISCPLDALAGSDFREASQMGLCECNVLFSELSDPVDSPRPVDCECFYCPEESAFGAAFSCNTPIAGICAGFDCDGVCNGDFMFSSSAPSHGVTMTTPSDTPSHGVTMTPSNAPSHRVTRTPSGSRTLDAVLVRSIDSNGTANETMAPLAMTFDSMFYRKSSMRTPTTNVDEVFNTSESNRNEGSSGSAVDRFPFFAQVMLLLLSLRMFRREDF